MRTKRRQISLLVPFREENAHRARLWHWLRRYWRNELPDAEIVIGRNYDHPFSKSRAINDAARHAHGDIFVILDADTYIPGYVVQQCADLIREAREDGYPLWFIPYRRIYRLTPEATLRVLASSPHDPLRFSTPPARSDVESTTGSAHGHQYGALIQIMPREAFETIGGWDPRFAGWGGEDCSALHAVDTLYGKHKTARTDVLHLWHPRIGIIASSRMWYGQKNPRINDKLTNRYNRANNNRTAMRALVDEGLGYVGWRGILHRWTVWFRSLVSR